MIHCRSMINSPVFLTSEDGDRADIPALQEWSGDLDDCQHAQLMENVAMGNLELIEKSSSKLSKKNGSVRE